MVHLLNTYKPYDGVEMTRPIYSKIAMPKLSNSSQFINAQCNIPLTMILLDDKQKSHNSSNFCVILEMCLFLSHLFSKFNANFWSMSNTKNHPVIRLTSTFHVPGKLFIIFKLSKVDTLCLGCWQTAHQGANSKACPAKDKKKSPLDKCKKRKYIALLHGNVTFLQTLKQ